MTDSIEDYRWLTTDDAQPWLQAAQEQAGDVLSAATHLRKHLSPGRAHLVLEQTELRRRAADKFPAAERLFFTPIGLQQATDAWVAAYKARRFATHAAVADLCCGIGGDAMALAARSANTSVTLAVDRQPQVVLLAAANLRAMSSEPAAAQSNVQAIAAEVSAEQVAGCSAWHIDPDRRPAGKRTTQVELCQPGPELIEELRRRQPNGAIKLAPASDLPAPWSAEAELEWISRQRECRQLVAWFAGMAQSPGRRRATALSPTGAVLGTVVGHGQARVAPCRQLGQYIYEPDPAVLAAGLAGELAQRFGLSGIDDTVGYLTGDARVHDPLLAAFAIREVLPYQVKRLKAVLRARDIGQVEVKKRGVSLDPAAVARELSGPGQLHGTLVLTRYQGSVTAIVAERV